jgi:hypothetical protein
MESHKLKWKSIKTIPKSGEFLIAVWEGDIKNPRQTYRIYHAIGFENGPSWIKKGLYRTCEGGVYKIVGWMPLIEQPD